MNALVETRRPRGRPRSEEVADIDTMLLQIALREFVAHGYGGASMRQIAKVAGMSRTTLYLRFDSKDALFRAIVRQQVERLSAATTLSTASGPAGLEIGLKTYANHSLKVSLEGDMLAVNRLIASESHRFPELGIAAAERTELGIAQISWFIRHCAEKDAIACSNADAVAETFIVMLRGWYLSAMLVDRAVDDAERQAWVDRAVHLLLSDRSAW